MAMSKKLILMLASMVIAFGAAAQQSAVRYLTDVVKPAESSDYIHLVPHSTKADAEKIHMGGLECFESDPLVLKAESHIECRLERFSTRFSKRLFLCVI